MTETFADTFLFLALVNPRDNSAREVRFRDEPTAREFGHHGVGAHRIG